MLKYIKQNIVCLYPSSEHSETQVPSYRCILPIWGCWYALYIYDTCWNIETVNESNSKPRTGSEHLLCISNLHFGPPPNDPIAALSWDHWTILEVDIRQYSLLKSCSYPTKWNEPQQKKCHGVKTYANVIQTIKQQKKRALASFSLLWSNCLSTRNSWI